METSIVLFGNNGMLGTYINKVLSNSFNITLIKRETYDVLKNSKEELEELFKKFNSNSIIINCIGLIPQTKEIEHIKYLKINSIFPKVLSILCIKYNFKMIHITTDCVFSGKKGLYNENDIKDELNIYGLSKAFGEDISATIIRTSIIGEQRNKNYLSLLEWLKSNSNKQVYGYINHYWNGLTCLQLAKIIEEIIIKKNFWNGVRHIYSNNISKYNLLKIINDVYNLNVDIIPLSHINTIDKTLTSIYTNLNDIDIKTQIEELNKFQF